MELILAIWFFKITFGLPLILKAIKKIYRSKILNKINKSKKISLVTKITNSKAKKIKLNLQILSKTNNLTF